MGQKLAANGELNSFWLFKYQVMMTLHFLSDVACDAELIQKSKNYIIIASLKSESVNRIPGSRLLISSLPGSALRKHAASLAMSTSPAW